MEVQEKVYSITKDHCQKMIGDNVCSGCGGEIKPIETVDNGNNPTFWAACERCAIYTWGCSKSMHEIARDLVLHRGYRAYSNDLEPAKSEANYNYWLHNQIRGTINTVVDVINIYENKKRGSDKR